MISRIKYYFSYFLVVILMYLLVSILLYALLVFGIIVYVVLTNWYLIEGSNTKFSLACVIYVSNQFIYYYEFGLRELNEDARYEGEYEPFVEVITMEMEDDRYYRPVWPVTYPYDDYALWYINKRNIFLEFIFRDMRYHPIVTCKPYVLRVYNFVFCWCVKIINLFFGAWFTKFTNYTHYLVQSISGIISNLVNYWVNLKMKSNIFLNKVFCTSMRIRDRYYNPLIKSAFFTQILRDYHEYKKAHGIKTYYSKWKNYCAK